MIKEVKNEALKNDVPIIMDDALEFILEYIKKHNVKNILEIGTAVGYSAISFASVGANVDTIERDAKMHKKALENIKKTNLDYKINAIYADALKYKLKDKKYDLIFIDAAKAQYIKFFNKYKHFLMDKGVIICDNLNFHNLDIDKVSRSTRQLIQKINKFKTFLKENSDYKTDFYNIGDGMSVSYKDEKNNNII